MSRYKKFTRGQKMCDMVKTEQQIPLDDTKIDEFQDTTFRSIQESPLPASFNESDMNELANLLGDSVFSTDEFLKSTSTNTTLLNTTGTSASNSGASNTTQLNATNTDNFNFRRSDTMPYINNFNPGPSNTMSDTNNSNSGTSNTIPDTNNPNPGTSNTTQLHGCSISNPNHPGTPYPSPDCSINHLDYDCNNKFCPYYVEKENVILQPLSQQSFSCMSECSTPQANTPLSDISYNSPQTLKKKRPRKDKGNIRERHVKDWLDVKRKTLRNLGKEYVSRKGVVKQCKRLGPPCSCRMKCFDKLNEEERGRIFKNFWSLGDRHKQWTYLANLVTKNIKRRTYTDIVSRRKYTLKYKLPVSDGEIIDYINVCKNFFLRTMSISNQVVNTALKKLDTGTGTVHSDQRGKHSKHPRKITESVINSVCEHIKSLQPVESHYTRQHSDKLYLDGDLNYHRLFEMYNEWLLTKTYENKAESERQYRDIANKNFKLSFYIPKKDQCDQCHIYKNINNPTEEQTAAHDKHINAKNLCRQLKQLDKNASKTSQGKIIAATFDFQKILNAPHGQLSVLYYKRKLSIFNFTVFDLSNKEAFCYMWHEGEAKRGANDVSSCLLNFIIKKQAEGAREFRFWSDNCAGQNRNRIVFAFYMFVVQKYKVTITHTFLEKGHTQAEGDSVHALIERSSKNKLIYTPLEWFSLVRWAKQDGKPYNVIEMKHPDFFDFRTLLKGRNWAKNINGDTVQWNKIKMVRVCAEDSFKIEYKYDLSDCSYMTIAVNSNTRRRQKIDGAIENVPCSLYPNSLPISKAKFDDLISLCESGLIPGTYHAFFKNLCVNTVAHDNSDQTSDSD